MVFRRSFMISITILCLSPSMASMIPCFLAWIPANCWSSSCRALFRRSFLLDQKTLTPGCSYCSCKVFRLVQYTFPSLSLHCIQSLYCFVLLVRYFWSYCSYVAQLASKRLSVFSMYLLIDSCSTLLIADRCIKYVSLSLVARVMALRSFILAAHRHSNLS